LLIDPAHGNAVWVPRPLPIDCPACGGLEFHSHAQLLAHVKTFAHQQNMAEPEERIPDAFVDPRVFDDSFSRLDNFARVGALFEYKQRVLRKLRAPMNDADVANMGRIQSTTLQAVASHLTDVLDEAELERIWNLCTIDRVTQILVDWTVNDFLDRGQGCCYRDVIVRGWESFRLPPGTHNVRLFLKLVTDSDHFDRVSDESLAAAVLSLGQLVV
jgi:hypothetical protein